MGVTGLWTVVQGCARPTKLETLNKKRLAVDASIWIYQFLKAVRDKEGKALRNSHVVGFFRRICKLLFFGIKPVFVFDGGAPILKRQTISGRKARREGRREDAIRTAGKLLAVQMQRRAEEEAERVKQRTQVQDEEDVPDADQLVYVNELGMNAQEKKQSRGFKKKDQYHLPEMSTDLASLGAPDDPRVMSQEELEEYARQFHSGEEINLYDFSAIDFESPFFVSLPASDRYNILNAARLRSRLRMGYSKEQLDTMFPDRMAFSKFQIDRVKERNELTQRLMNLNGMNGQDFNFEGRVAGEKGKEYVLVKNDGVEGGWALGVVGNKEGDRAKPINVDELDKKAERAEDDWEEEDFEDVPIEGLNRLPKQLSKHSTLKRGVSSSDALEKRRELYLRRKQQAQPGRAEHRTASPARAAEDESLFVEENDEEAEFEDVLPQESDSVELQRAIAMSLEMETEPRPNWEADMLNGPAIDKPLQYNKKNAKAGRAFAHVANERAGREIPAAPFAQESDDEDAGSLAFSTPKKQRAQPREAPSTPDHSFSGPLPFASLNLGKSMLGKKKKPEDEAGGFEKETEKSAEPLPPWFEANLEQSYQALNKAQKDDRELLNAERPRPRDVPVLHRNKTREVIDLDEVPQKQTEIIDVDSSSDDGNDEDVKMVDVLPLDDEIRNDDLADKVRAEPPVSKLPAKSSTFPAGSPAEEEIEWSESDTERSPAPTKQPITIPAGGEMKPAQPVEPVAALAAFAEDESDEDGAEFEDVDTVDATAKNAEPPMVVLDTAPAAFAEDESDEDGAEFEDVGPVGETTENAEPPTVVSDKANMEKSAFPEPVLTETTAPEITQEAAPSESASPQRNGHAIVGEVRTPSAVPKSPTKPIPALPQENTFDSIVEDAEFDDFSDPDEADLLKSLAEEAEEHARFAASLAQSARTTTKEDYEKELKQLRNQQKRDLRDSDEVTQIMITECQQLLKMFGLPYITAPMEAEAQCAELVSLGLVDGIVTDDSDVFLFGGTRVYKNMFNQAKFVECYLATDLEKEYSLTREKVIQAAHLLGSDYTEGLPHVGPVTAMEILSEFPSLTDFKEWWDKIQAGQKIPGDEKNSFRRKFRKNASKVFLPLGFPDTRVDQAYLQPEVDSDPSPFVWGVPDLDALRSFLMATVGWNRERADEILVPVIRDMNRREVEGTQANITHFFNGPVGTGTIADRSDAFAPRKKAKTSTRMESALGRIHEKARQRLAGIEPDIDGDEPAAKTTPALPAKKKARRKRKAVDVLEDEDEDLGEVANAEIASPPRKATKRAARNQA